ncbi:unnamed protein product [Brachionus calyciflorus]|uniref:EF-hand domain-containing protein n=1 Tax=Brachionus calyciflorus TaxID=104777 RepID=A0A814KMY2_9BILA|nr:unnamed protein product [Brachionus calyciflorus]
MGSGTSKVSNNKTPPSPNSSNFPIQSNPKFQSSGNFNNQYQNQWSNQNPNENYFNSEGNNNMNQKNSFQNNYNDYNRDYQNGPSQYPQRNNQRPFPDINQFNNNNYNPNNNYSRNNPQNRNLMYEYDDESKFPQPPPRINVLQQRNKMLRPNVKQLTPFEIEEYKRKGFNFPPYRGPQQMDNMNYNPSNGFNQNTNFPEEYTVTADEVNTVRNVFDQNCGPDKRMDFQQFSYMYQKDYGTAKQAFSLMDQDDDGLINFDEFLLGYCKTRSQSNHAIPIEAAPSIRQPVRPRRVDNYLPFGPLDEYDPYGVPLENIANSLKPFVY